MSALSAVPAAVRLPRTVGGRRALLTVLFLGVLSALAFFFGGSAQAATHSAQSDDGVAAALKADDSDAPARKRFRSEPFDEQFEQNRKKSSKASGEAVGKVTEPVAESGVSTEKLTRPVHDTISLIAEKVQVDRVTDGLLTGSRDERAHESGDHAHHRGHGKDCDEPHAHHTGDESGRQVTTLPAQALPDDVPTHHVTSGNGAHGGAGNGLPGGPAPLQDSPCVLAGSVTHSVGDGKNGMRGGADQLAAYVTDMERFSLLRPGAVRADSGTSTRDRSTEILEFPG